MGFLLRAIPTVLLALVIFIVVAVLLLLIVWVVNRGLQLFFRLFGYELFDFFGWFVRATGLSKMIRRRKKRTRSKKPDAPDKFPKFPHPGE